MAQLGGAHRTISQDMVSSSSPSCQLSTDKVFADGGAKLLTNDQIYDLIAEKIAKFRSGSSKESSLSHKWLSGSLFQANCNVPSSSSDDVPKSSSSFKDCVYKPKPNSAGAQQYTPKAAQPPEDHLKIIKAKEFSHVQTEVDATRATNEQKTPLVRTTISEVTCEELTETCPGLTLNCSSSQEEHKSQLNGNKNLRDGDVVPDVSVEPMMQEQDLGINNIVEMDNVQDINSNNSEGKTTEDQQHCYITCEEKTLSCRSLKDPQYEDVSSDEDKSKPQSSEMYEDVNEDENQCVQGGMVSPQQNFEISKPTTGNPRFGLDEQLCSKCDQKTNISCAVFKDEHELDNQLNDSDDDDDDWEVIPIAIFNLKFEEADDGECGETSWSCKNSRLKKPTPKPVPASAFSQMEVFDTPAEQELAEKFGQVLFVVPSSGSNHERKFQNLWSRKEKELEDSFETDDSSDYSSGSESNFLTMSKPLVKNCSSLQMSTVDSERKNQGSEAKTLRKSSNQEVIINLDSDDESGKDCVKETESTERCSPHKEENTETLKRSWGTEKDPHVNKVSRQKNSNDDIIVILSDSDDGVEICDKAMSPSSDSVDSAFLPKRNTADHKNIKDLKQSLLKPSEPSSKSDRDKPGTSRPSTLRKISFHESSREVQDLTKKRLSSSETEDSDDDLNNSGSSLCTNRKKVKFSEADGSLGPRPVIPRLFARLYTDSSKPVQLVNESGVQSQDKDLFIPNSSTKTSYNDLFRNKHSTKDKTGKFAPESNHTNKVHTTTPLKVSQESAGPKICGSLPKLPYNRSSTSSPPILLKKSPSSSIAMQSVERPNHARNKVFSDWRRNHVPLRRERKVTKRKNYTRHTL